MWVDAGTKDMDLGHLRRILDSGRWSVTYSPTFVKQVAKAKKVSARAVGPSVMSVVGIVKMDWASMSLMEPRVSFSAAELPLRTSVARVELPSGQLQWRVPERDLEYAKLPNQRQLRPERVPILVMVFSRGSGP